MYLKIPLGIGMFGVNVYTTVKEHVSENTSRSRHVWCECVALNKQKELKGMKTIIYFICKCTFLIKIQKQHNGILNIKTNQSDRKLVSTIT